jgi:hypothetical protein
MVRVEAPSNSGQKEVAAANSRKHEETAGEPYQEDKKSGSTVERVGHPAIESSDHCRRLTPNAREI